MSTDRARDSANRRWRSKAQTPHQIIGELIEWDAAMGHHESPVWQRARAIYRATGQSMDGKTRGAAEILYARLNAARVMLAALEETVGCYAAGDVADEPPFVETLRAAIAQAKAAGMKAVS